MIYATPAELAAFVDPDTKPPAAVPLATVLLRKASGLVTDAISGLVYQTDSEGVPTLQRYRTAVRDATLEQASAWAVNGIDPRKGASQIKRRIKSKSLGNGSVSTTYEDGSPELLVLATGDELTNDAWLILSNAGMISNRVAGSRGVELFNVEQRYYDPTTGALE